MVGMTSMNEWLTAMMYADANEGVLTNHHACSIGLRQQSVISQASSTALRKWNATTTEIGDTPLQKRHAILNAGKPYLCLFYLLVGNAYTVIRWNTTIEICSYKSHQ